MNRRDRYSRTVALLKVAFPLAALALLSTLFLLSRAIEPETVIPFADKEIQDRLRDQQITGPFFTGSTSNGGQISFSAKKLVTKQGQMGISSAEDATASLQTLGGATFDLTADEVHLDIPGNSAEMTGHVTMVTSQGYRLVTSQLTSKVSILDITAPEQVNATGSLGKIVAGNMRIFTPNTGNSTQILFSGGVKVVYTPE